MELAETPNHDASMKRFARDMAEVRRRSGLSLDDLHESTKISRRILEEFEETGLVDNELFNRVYLRSFINTYARTVGFDQERALAGLESALHGNYRVQEDFADGVGEAAAGQKERADGEDAVAWGTDPDAAASRRDGGTAGQKDGADTTDAKGDPDAVGSKSDTNKAGSKDEVKTTEPETGADTAGSKGDANRAGSKDDVSTAQAPGNEVMPAAAVGMQDAAPGEDVARDGRDRQTSETKRPWQPGVAHRFRFEPIKPESPRRAPANRSDTPSTRAPRKSNHPALISTAVHDYHEPPPQKGLIISPSRVKAAVLIFLVIAITVWAAILALRLSSNGAIPDTSASSAVRQAGGQQPTVVETLPPESAPRPAPLLVVRDTILVTVAASREPLDPIRVQVDRDLRRPYWIEAGDSLNFAMTDQIVLDTLLDRATVKLEGIPYTPMSYRSLERLVITRDSVRHFAESLQSR